MTKELIEKISEIIRTERDGNIPAHAIAEKIAEVVDKEYDTGLPLSMQEAFNSGDGTYRP